MAEDNRGLQNAGPFRLPYNPKLEEKYGVTKQTWNVLCSVIFPDAKNPDAVLLAIQYCKERKLDIMKKVVYIISYGGREVLIPSVSEARITAFRTGNYAGNDPVVLGPDIELQCGSDLMVVPMWAQTTIYRMVGGQRFPFHGPRVYWAEAYKTAGKDNPTPNKMWRTSPCGMLIKCSEAAALRVAFPEETGGMLFEEEFNGRSGVDIPNVGGSYTSAALPAEYENADVLTEVQHTEAIEYKQAEDEAGDLFDNAKVETREAEFVPTVKPEQAKPAVAATVSAADKEKLQQRTAAAAARRSPPPE
jgi:phage recombination protein Bet